MTLILKSNQRIDYEDMLKGLGRDIAPALRMDFVDEVYTKKGVVFSDINTALNFTQPKKGNYDDNYNFHYGSDSNSSRITIEPYIYKKGLLVEREIGNYFLNSSNPVTQQVSIFNGANPSWGVGVLAYFKAYGSGKIVIKDTVTGVVYGEASEGSDYNRRLTSGDKTNAFKFTVEVIGNLEHVDVFHGVSHRYSVSRVTSGGSYAAPIQPQKVTFKSGLLNELVPNGVGCLIIKVILPHSLADRREYNGVTNAVAYIGNGTKGVYIAFRENSTSGIIGTAIHRGLSGGSVETIRAFAGEDTVDFARTQTYAINFNNTSSSMAYNGNFLGVITDDAAQGANQVYIGSSPNWSTADVSLISEVIVLNENLTQEELIAVSKN